MANSLQKELKDILKFLGNNPFYSSLSSKIKKEIQYFETFKKGQDNKESKYLANTEKAKTGGKVFLTNKEKEILKKYYSKSSKGSYTSIYAAKDLKNPLISP